MARLLIGNDTYHTVSSSAFYEVDYEGLVLSKAALLFPDHIVTPFKMTVRSEAGAVKADLALIERDYRQWWVVEVELAHHSLSNHVLPQIHKLATADYGPDVAMYLSSQDSSLDLSSLHAMLRGAQPQVLVIVDRLDPSWTQPLGAYGAAISIVEVFRSDRNDHVLRLNGHFPEPLGNLLSLLRFDATLPRLMILDSPAAIPRPSNTRISLDFNGATTEWMRVDTANRVWLAPMKTNLLPPGRRYAIYRSDSDRLVIRTHFGG